MLADRVGAVLAVRPERRRARVQARREAVLLAGVGVPVHVAVPAVLDPDAAGPQALPEALRGAGERLQGLPGGDLLPVLHDLPAGGGLQGAHWELHARALLLPHVEELSAVLRRFLRAHAGVL